VCVPVLRCARASVEGRTWEWEGVTGGAGGKQPNKAAAATASSVRGRRASETSQGCVLNMRRHTCLRQGSGPVRRTDRGVYRAYASALCVKEERRDWTRPFETRAGRPVAARLQLKVFVLRVSVAEEGLC
jgi:hypothetical protein